MSSDPVFFDPSGNRVLWIKRVGLFLGTLATITATLFVLSLLAVPFFTQTGESATSRLRRLLPTVPKRQQRMSHLLLQRDTLALDQEISSEEKTTVQQPAGAPVVIGFYDNSDTAADSFAQRVGNLTHWMPTWVQLDSTGNDLDFRDFDATNKRTGQFIQLARQNGVAIVPVLQNVLGTKFDSNPVHNLLQSPEAQKVVVARLTNWLVQEKFQGLNLDFEEVPASDFAARVKFEAMLAEAFRPFHLSLSVDLEPSLETAQLGQLAKPCDMAVLMAYNEHFPGGDPGPVASWPFTFSLVKRAASVIPARQLVLGMANYGYDWTQDSKSPAEDLSYADAMQSASDSADGATPEDVLDFDPQELNTTFSYEEDGKDHEVWLMDAAGAYNQWLLARKMKLRGTSLWRLGTEDPGIWTYFRREAPAKVTADQLATVTLPSIEPQGNGDILQVDSETQAGHRTLDFDSKTGLCTDQEYDVFPSSYILKHSGFAPNKNVALTFDDGPDADWTPQVLDILKENNVKAAFFLVGNNAERYSTLVRREWDEGHEIGNHSFTHTNLGLASPRRVTLELNATQRAIESITGHSTCYLRPPYNADSDPTTPEELQPVIQGARMGYLTVGESIDPEDWNPLIQPHDGPVRARTTLDIVNAAVNGAVANEKSGRGNVILLHDAGGDRSKTLQALPLIISELRTRGFHFVSLSTLIGKPRSVLMPALTGRQVLVAGFDRKVFNFVFGFEWLLTIGFLAAIGLGVLRVAIVMPLTIIARRREVHRQFDPGFQPFVSVLIAAYNEAPVINKTIESVLASDYPNLEVIVIDDGSKDDTGDTVEAAFGGHPRVRLLRQPNGGKASALNHGLAEAKGEIFVGFDADTQVARDAISLLVRHFDDPRVGAVAGNVKVGNRLNMLTRWQAVEYVTSQNLDRRAYGLLNCITVVPGAIGAWRRSAVQQAGGYLTDTLAEDMDLTWRLRRDGWGLVNEDNAHAYTEAPDTLRSFFKQRYRWAFGTLQCLMKHRGAIGRYGWFGALALPGIWIFQFLLQWLAPCVDLQLFVAALSVALTFGHSPEVQGYQLDPLTLLFLQKTAFYYALFFAVELTAAITAVRLDKEKPSLLWWLFWQRFVYRQMLYIVVLKATWTALVGYRQGWGKLARKGTVSLPEKEPAATE